MDIANIKANEKVARREFDKSLGEYLKSKRVERGLRQEDVSSIIGLNSKQFISNIERGLCAAPNYMVKIMLAEYRINASDFIGFISTIKKDYYKKIFGKSGRRKGHA